MVFFIVKKANNSDIYECSDKDLILNICIKDKDINHYLIDIKYLDTNFNTEKPNNYLVYSHFSGTKDDNGVQKGYYNYHGLTGRTMSIRLEEHKKASSCFGKQLRNTLNYPVEYIYRVIKDGLTKDEAFNFEEKVIKENSLFRDGKGNNMIPGGYLGLRIAKSLGYSDREKAEIDLEEAAEDPKKLHDICKKAYDWNELIEDQIKNIVCKNKNNFNEKEVTYIRIMSLQIESILEVYKLFREKFNYSIMNIGLMSRVEKVINGETYRFVT